LRAPLRVAVYDLSRKSLFGRREGARPSSPHKSSSATEREGHGDATAAQVEAALNRKNADVVDVDRSGSATLVPADARRGAGDEWVPDQETGVFVPADEESSGPGDGGVADVGGARGQAPSVLDQAVFVREEHMEDVERPAVGVDDAGAA
jgi:hypothetical protein